MNNDLKILITGSLNTGKSIGEINTALKGIQQKIKPLKLNVEIDEKITKTLRDFSRSMEKMKEVQQDLQKSYKEEEVVVKKLDGSVEKTTKQYLKSGEIIEKTRKTINERTKAVEKETKALGKYSDQLDDVAGKQQKLITRQDGAGNPIGSTEKYRDENSFIDTSVSFNKDGRETSRTITENLDQQKKATEQLTKAKEELIQKVRILTNENKINNEEAKAIADLTNTTNDINKVKEYSNSLKDLQSQHKIVNKEIKERVALQEENNKKAKEYEQWWLKSLKNQELDLVKNQEKLRQKLSEIKREGRLTEQQFHRLSNAINSVKDTKGLDKVKTDLREVQGVLKNVGMFEQLKVAMSRIPINFQVGVKPF